MSRTYLQHIVELTPPLVSLLYSLGNWEIVQAMADMLSMQCNLAEAQVGMLEVMEVENNRFQANNKQFEASLAVSEAQNTERAEQLEVFKGQVESLTAETEEFKRQNAELAENLDTMKQQNEAMKGADWGICCGACTMI
jgi:septal ring factor EnvC (AmiA/AmiB activator)